VNEEEDVLLVEGKVSSEKETREGKRTNDEILIETGDEAKVLVCATVGLAALRDVGEVDEHFLELADACEDSDKELATKEGDRGERRTFMDDIEERPELLDVPEKRVGRSTGFRCVTKGRSGRWARKGKRGRNDNLRAEAFANILCVCAIQLCAIVVAFQIPSCVNNPSGVTC
jgi:hypothetical protein